MNKAYEDVAVFHQKFNHPTAEKPLFMPELRAQARSKWMREEIQEFLDAENIYDQADAMIDLIYFALGTMVEMGVKPDALFDIVHQANMQKLWSDGKPHYNADGKTIKPEGWQNPYPLLKAAIDKNT